MHDFRAIPVHGFNSRLLQDVWWKFVAQTMEEAPEDEHGWREPVQKMAYDFLVDDDFSFLLAFQTKQWLR